MDILTGQALSRAAHLFDGYPANQALIFSVLEGQYDGALYTDSRETMRWAVLQTPFMQHFAAGDAAALDADALEALLFDTILPAQPELVVFAPDASWHAMLDAIFQKRGGVMDARKVFQFDPNQRVNKPDINLPAGMICTVEQKPAVPFSHLDTWCATLTLEVEPISTCSVLMQGHGYAELEIETAQAHQGHGYATYIAALLIERLLEEGRIPTWTTWPYREASQRVALKLGFDAQPDARAWIWAKGM